jgi:hypothetical protein
MDAAEFLWEVNQFSRDLSADGELARQVWIASPRVASHPYGLAHVS